MGVRGLATLARKRGGSTLETIDADTTLLIDGSGLCAHALRDQKCEYGGDLGALDAATTQFLERLLNRDFRVVVYLDGDQRRMKTHTSEERLAKRRDEWSTLERYADGSQEVRRPAGDLPRPALASRVFEACLRRLDAPIFYTVFYGPFSAVYVFAKRALLDQRYGLPVSASRRAGAAAVAREAS